MDKLYIDYETRSALDVATVGTYKYAFDPSTEIILVSWALNDGAVHTDTEVTDELYRLLEAGDVLKIAHNAEFDAVITQAKVGIDFNPEEWFDTAYQAAYFGYPRKLAYLAAALKTTRKASQEEMLFFSTPVKEKRRKNAEPAPIRFNDPAGYPEEWERFKQYSRLDVEVMRECHLKMRVLPDIEEIVMALTFDMNKNGVPFDMSFAREIKKRADEYAAAAGKEARARYGIENLRSVPQVKAALEREGVFMETLNAKERNGVTHPILELRDKASGAAFSKIGTAAERICADGRLHGEFVGYGAHTGRWSSRGVQLQNFARILSEVSLDLDKVQSYSHLRQHMRLSIYAPDPYWFVCADLSQIEARIVAWLANCGWRMTAFENGEDIYSRSAERMFGLPHVDKSMPERQMGKCAELGLGYGGAANAILRIAPDFYREVGESKVVEIVQRWRSANPEVCRLWRILETAFKEAMQRGVVSVKVGIDAKLVMRYDGHTAIITLPSGRSLYYRGVHTEDSDLYYLDYSRGGEHPVRTKFWGGVLLENVTQAIARDVLVEIMNTINWRYPTYKLIGSVHDEVWYLTTDPTALDNLLGVMKEEITWADGLVTKGDGFISKRYIK